MHDYDYYDALAVTYTVEDIYGDFVNQKTLEVLDLIQDYMKEANQNTFARLIDLALAQ